jgi:hypothetical protein
MSPGRPGSSVGPDSDDLAVSLPPGRGAAAREDEASAEKPSDAAAAASSAAPPTAVLTLHTQPLPPPPQRQRRQRRPVGSRRSLRDCGPGRPTSTSSRADRPLCRATDCSGCLPAPGLGPSRPDLPREHCAAAAAAQAWRRNGWLRDSKSGRSRLHALWRSDSGTALTVTVQLGV